MLSVFDVDIGDGEPIRKLPYNRSGTLVSCVQHYIPVLFLIFHGFFLIGFFR